MGEVEAVEDVVVLHDDFQVVEADEVDELVDAGQVVVADGLRVAMEQEAGVEDIAGLGAVDQSVDLERGQLLQTIGADAVDGGDVVFVDLLGLAVGDLDLERAHDVVAVVQHLAVHCGRVLGIAQAVDGQLGGRGTGLDGLGQIDGGTTAIEVEINRETWQVVGQEQGGAALEDEGVTVRLVSSWAMARIKATWRACSGVNGWCSNGPGEWASGVCWCGGIGGSSPIHRPQRTCLISNPAT